MNSIQLQNVLSHFQKVDLKIYEAARTVDYSRWLSPKKQVQSKHRYFEALSSQIISQQLSGKAAETIHARFVALFPDKKISPEETLLLSDQAMRDAGMSWSKASYVKNVASSIVNSTIEWNRFSEMNDAEVVKELTKIKGLGAWSAEMFLMFTLGREDVFSYGDVGLKNGIKKIYSTEAPTIEQIKDITEKWMPYRTYGSIALWKCLE